MSVSTVDRRVSWAATSEHAVRRLAAVTWAGGLLGFLVAGIGSRLAMLLLARLNPQVTGLSSDDDFIMGQLTSASLALLATTTVLGVFGGGIYFLLRGLMIGPRWFQILSISLGSAVVVGDVIVHIGGIDFTLDPGWLAIAMFVAIPWAYAAALTVISERWLAPEGRFMTAPKRAAGLPLLLWVPIAPFLAALLLGLAVFEAACRTPAGHAVLRHPAWPWVLRLALGLLFAMSLVSLVRDVLTLA